MVIRVIAGIANNINQAVKLGNSQGKLYYSDIDKLQSKLDDVKNVQDRKIGIRRRYRKMNRENFILFSDSFDNDFCSCRLWWKE